MTMICKNKRFFTCVIKIFISLKLKEDIINSLTSKETLVKKQSKNKNKRFCIWRFSFHSNFITLHQLQQITEWHSYDSRVLIVTTILGDPGAASRDNGIFMGESLQQERESSPAHVVNFRPGKSRRPDYLPLGLRGWVTTRSGNKIKGLEEATKFNSLCSAIPLCE